MPQAVQMALLAIFPALALAAMINDFRHYRIPNKLNLAIFLSFFPVALLLGMPWEQMLWHVIGFVVVFAIMFTIFMIMPAGKFGGGDAKMISASAIWIDFHMLPAFIVMTMLAGGVLAIVMWLWRVIQVEFGVWMNGDATLRKVMSYQVKLPYGAAIAAGGIFAYTQSWWQALLA